MKLWSVNHRGIHIFYSKKLPDFYKKKKNQTCMGTLTSLMKVASSSGGMNLFPMEKVIAEKKLSLCLEGAF